MDFSFPSYFADKTCYFAAANGYDGFRSYFGEFFFPDAFRRIYILKGGPGTGKSRLLKNIGTVFESRGCRVEWIFCSSDPSSLDGVTIYENGKGVAMLDGTAPHERDTQLPGAVDSLINLGDGWDEEALVARRPDITTLSEAKRRAYQKGYEYLSLSSKYADKTRAVIESVISEKDMSRAAETFLDSLSRARSGTAIRRPIAAFCRFGYVHVPTYELLARRVYLPSCDALVRPIFLNALAEAASERGILHLRAPSPFRDTDTDALLFPDDEVAVLGYTPQNEQSILPLAIGAPISATLPQTVLLSEEIRDDLLRRAQRELSYASEAHASLESIYTAAMDFQNNDRLTDALVRRIDGVLYGTT